jgi:ABC-type branched-subunit amino acid transport system substrate-binding protein
VKRAGKWDPVAIRDALKATDIPQTTFGPVKFDAQGQNEHPILVTQIQKGKYVIVSPKSEATGDPIIPTPNWSGR